MSGKRVLLFSGPGIFWVRFRTKGIYAPENLKNMKHLFDVRVQFRARVDSAVQGPRKKILEVRCMGSSVESVRLNGLRFMSALEPLGFECVGFEQAEVTVLDDAQFIPSSISVRDENQKQK